MLEVKGVIWVTSDILDSFFLRVYRSKWCASSAAALWHSLYCDNGLQPSFKQTYMKERNDTENRFSSSCNFTCVFCRSFHCTCNLGCISSWFFVLVFFLILDTSFWQILSCFFFPVQGYRTETPELQLSLHNHTKAILLAGWNNTLFTLAQLRSDPGRLWPDLMDCTGFQTKSYSQTSCHKQLHTCLAISLKQSIGILKFVNITWLGP